MSKKILVVIPVCIAILVAVYLWISSPNAEAKTSHQSILCNTLSQLTLPQSEADILDAMFSTFDNSIPRHAYNRPKFAEKYAKSLIHDFSSLTIEQQVEAQQDHKKCMSLIQ